MTREKKHTDGDQPLEDPAERQKLEDEYRKLMGLLMIGSPGSAAGTLVELDSWADFKEVRDFIKEVVANVNEGILIAPESLLVNQAYTLNALFHKQVRLANQETRVDVGQYHADIAFRAQNQCQRTLRTLLEYKNPKRTTFIKQQNNAVNQQINQGDQPKEISEKNIPANELLEVNHDARLDPGAPQEAIGSNKELETVGKIDRAEDRDR